MTRPLPNTSVMRNTFRYLGARSGRWRSGTASHTDPYVLDGFWKQ